MIRNHATIDITNDSESIINITNENDIPINKTFKFVFNNNNNNNNNNSPRSYKGVLSSPEPPTRWHPPFSSLLVPLQPATPIDTTLTVKHTSHQLQAIHRLNTVAHNN
jgi:hypothetical protein